MNPAQIDIEKVDKLTQIAARDGLAIFISVMVVCCMLPFLWFQFNRMYKVLLNIDKNTKGYISDEALKDVLKIYVSDIRNKEQSFIYHKIEKNHIAENYENYIENEILNTGLLQINEKREALIHLTTYNNINRFRSITEKNLTWHIETIKQVFSDELTKEKINYNNLKNVTNRELELFEQETINQLNKIF